MMYIKEEIRKRSQYNEMDKDSLVDLLIYTRAELRVAKAEGEWLDTLANWYRDSLEEDKESADELRGVYEIA